MSWKRDFVVGSMLLGATLSYLYINDLNPRERNFVITGMVIDDPLPQYRKSGRDLLDIIFVNLDNGERRAYHPPQINHSRWSSKQKWEREEEIRPLPGDKVNLCCIDQNYNVCLFENDKGYRECKSNSVPRIRIHPDNYAK